MKGRDDERDGVLVLHNISKSFAGVQALKGVDLTIHAGQVHSLVGQNGAGKSTLIKILGGLERSDSGSAQWNGVPLALHGDPRVSQAVGISVIHQQLDLFPNLSGIENIAIGRQQRRRFGLFVDWKAAEAQATTVRRLLGLEFDLRLPLHQLRPAQRVLVAVARAVISEARLIVMDEPTSALGADEVAVVHSVVRALCEKGSAVLFVSHRLDEVIDISDRITVMRDGSVVASFDRSDGVSSDELAACIIGATPARTPTRAPRSPVSPHSVVPVVELRHVSLDRVLRDVSLELRSGEIVGLAGLVGSGRSELAEVVAGLVRPSAGDVLVEGRQMKHLSSRQAARLGIGLLPEDRHHQGTLPTMSVRANATVSSIGKYRWGPFIARRREGAAVRSMIQQFQVVASSIETPIRTLSGGNQQKVIVARWVDCSPKILLFDEPTQGIDVGAKAEVINIMRGLANDGCGILFISSEIEEVVAYSDRVVVLREGQVAGEYRGGTANLHDVLRACYRELPATPECKPPAKQGAT